MSKLSRFLCSGAGLLALAAIVAGCGQTVTVVNNGPTATIPATTQPSTSPTPIPTCATLVPGSGPASAGSSFSDVSFPTGSVGTAPALHASGTGRWTISLMQACAPNTTASFVRSFYAGQLPALGWAYSPTLPFDGGYQAPCGDAYCWAKGTASRYVGLEFPTDHAGGFVTFQLRLFIPPPTPNCSGGPFQPPPYKSFASNDSSLPLPPLTVYGAGDGSGALLSNTMCSAGTADSVNSFYTTELPKLGWHQGSFPPHAPPEDCGGPGSYSGWISPDGKAVMSWSATGGGVPATGWNLSVCAPGGP